jgi:hypothetical protein
MKQRGSHIIIFAELTCPLPPSSFPIPQQAVQERAVRVLQQKKMYEAQIASLEQQNFNMESAAMTTENLRNTMVTVEAMKDANKHLRKEYGKVLCITVQFCRPQPHSHSLGVTLFQVDIDKIEVRSTPAKIAAFD